MVSTAAPRGLGRPGSILGTALWLEPTWVCQAHRGRWTRGLWRLLCRLSRRIRPERLLEAAPGFLDEASSHPTGGPGWPSTAHPLTIPCARLWESKRRRPARGCPAFWAPVPGTGALLPYVPIPAPSPTSFPMKPAPASSTPRSIPTVWSSPGAATAPAGPGLALIVSELQHERLLESSGDKCS